MGFESFWLQFNNGKKEQLGDTKSGIRKEQIDKKFHNLFDAYDTNQSGLLEDSELKNVFTTLSSYDVNKDNILDNTENQLIKSIFSLNGVTQDIDFQGFIKSASKASEEIVSTNESQLPDGGKEIITEYANGTIVTVGYYPDGTFKYKITDEEVLETKYFLCSGENKFEVSKQDFEMYDLLIQGKEIPNSKETQMVYLLPPNASLESKTIRKPNLKFEFSEKAKFDIEVRKQFLEHFISTHDDLQDALDSMGFLDDTGAVINKYAGETWNYCVNRFNKIFKNGEEVDYKNFDELAEKFESSKNRSDSYKSDLEGLFIEHPDAYFKYFETDYPNYNLEKGVQFQQLTEQYQVASVLDNRIKCLEKVLEEIRKSYVLHYDNTNTVGRGSYNTNYNPRYDSNPNTSKQQDIFSPMTFELNDIAKEYLRLALDADDATVEKIIKLFDPSSNDGGEQFSATINALITETKKVLDQILIKKEYSLVETDGNLDLQENVKSESYSLDELKEEYQNTYKSMYGTDFVPDELTDKVMDAKATGGFVKIAAITIVSILITKSPVMQNIMKASAGAAVDGAAANFVRSLTSQFGQKAVQQGIKFAMSTGTLATDVGLTLLNQVTDNREGINGEEVWETTKGAAKYIYFGAFVGSPLAQAVTQKVGKLGIAGKLFVNGTKTTQGAITTTTITGEQLVQNFMKASNSIVAKGAGFATDIAAFTLLDITTEDIAPGEALESQAEMLTGLKIMHNAFEYMLGGRTHTAIQKAKWEAAIEKSGVKNWNIKEIKTPTADGKGFKVVYDVDFNGIPLGKINDANALITAMMGKVSETYRAMETEANSKPKTETAKSEEVIIQEICDKYKDLSDTELQAEIIRETALGNEEKVAELTIAFTQRGHKVSFKNSEGVATVEGVGRELEAKFEEQQTQAKDDILTRLSNANSRDDFRTIRDEIMRMPKSIERDKLYQSYIQAYNAWRSNPARPDIRMEYVPNASNIQVNKLQEFQSLQDLIDKAPKAELNENDANIFLRNFGLSEENIAEIKEVFKNKYKEVVLGVKKYMSLFPDGVEGLDSSELFSNIMEISKSPESCAYYCTLNEQSLSFISSKLGITRIEVAGMLEQCTQSSNLKPVINKIFESSKKSGIAFNEIIYSLNEKYTDKLCDKVANFLTPEQVIAEKHIADILGKKFDIAEALEQKNTEKITPEFLKELRQTFDKFNTLKIEPQTDNCDLVIHIEKMKDIIARIEEYGFDFSWYKPHGNANAKVSFEAVEKLFNSPDIKKSKEFIGLCSDRFKDIQPDLVLKYATDERCLEAPQEFAELFNTMSKIPCNDNAVFRNLDTCLNKPGFDVKGMTEVAQAFVDIGVWPKDGSAYSLNTHGFGNHVIIPYKENTKFIHAIKEFYSGEDSQYTISDYMKEPFRGIAPELLDSSLKMLKDNGLYGKIHPSDLRCILEEEGTDLIQKIIETKNPEFLKGHWYLFNRFETTELNRELENLYKHVKNNNAEYSNLSLDEQVSLLKHLGTIISDWYDKLMYGREFNPESLAIKNFVNKNLEQFAIELFNDKSLGLSLTTKMGMYDTVNEKNNLYADDINEQTVIDGLRTLKKEVLGEDNKNAILRENDLKCKNTTPEFVNWVKEFLNSKDLLKLITMPNFSKEKLINDLFETSKILRYVNQKPQDYLNGQYSNEIIDALKEIRKNDTDKKAYNKLSEVDRTTVEKLNAEIETNIEQSYVDILGAISATDIETVKLCLDMRFAMFNNKISEINNLPLENKTILSDLIRHGKRINKNGQPDKLTGQQKLDLINIMRIYNGTVEDFQKYKIPVDSKSFVLDIDQLRKDIFTQILKENIMSEAEISQLSLENLNWDMRYISLLRNRPSMDEGELSIVIRESSKGTFKSFISDPNNIHGAANIETERLFQKSGLNYEQWGKGPEEQTFSVGGKSYKIKLWNRIPQESLFNGNYTTCCTALDGSNGGSMANYLLNTAINVVEIKDSKGQVIGMSRCYMAEIEGKKALIMENIEVNNNYNKELSANGGIIDFANNIFEYMKDFADIVGGDGTPVYMSTSYHKIGDAPFEQFKTTTGDVSLIGSISKSEIYLNTYKGYVKIDNLKNRYASFHVIRE